MSISLQHTTEIQLTIPRHVICEGCGTEYVYEMKRTALGVAESGLFLGRQSAKDEAMSGAAAVAEHIVKHDCSAVPCPRCLTYPRHMYEQAGRQKWKDLNVLVVLFTLLGAGALCFLVMSLKLASNDKKGTESTASVAAGPGIALVSCFGLALFVFFLKRSLVRGHDPNRASRAKREAVAKARAMSMEEFGQLQCNRIKLQLFGGKRKVRKDEAGKASMRFGYWIREKDAGGGPIEIALDDTKTGILRVPADVEDGDEIAIEHGDSSSNCIARIHLMVCFSSDPSK